MLKKIFFVIDDSKNACNCLKIFSIVKSQKVFSFSKIKYQAISDNDPDYPYYTQKKDLVVLFGINKFKDSSYTITTKNNPIDPGWFKNKINCAIFFMPEGTELLKHQDWLHNFDGWVTFKSKYEFLTDDMKILTDKVPLLYKKLFKILVNVKSPKNAYDIIVNIYDETIKDFLNKKSILKYKNLPEIKMSVYKLNINQQNLVYKE